MPPINERVRKHRQAKHAKVIERIEGRYETQEVPFGIVYKWTPECLVVECICSKRSVHKKADLLGASVTTCECGEDDRARLREKLLTELLDEAYEANHHPWRYWHTFAYVREIL